MMLHRESKGRKKVIKWLKDPVSDSALYKMWGNGIALPCAVFVMEGIASQTERNNAHGEKVQLENQGHSNRF